MSTKHENLSISILVVAWALGVTGVLLGGTWIYSNSVFSIMDWIANVGVTKVIVGSIIAYILSTILQIQEYSGWALVVALLGFCLSASILAFILTSDYETGSYGWSLFFASIIIGVTNGLFLNSERDSGKEPQIEK